MGSEISIADSPAGKSSIGRVYQTTTNVELSCSGYAEDKTLRNINICPRNHTRPTHYTKNKRGFRVLIRPGLKICFVDITKYTSLGDSYYTIYFKILEDVGMNDILEFNDYNERGIASSDNVLWEWMDKDFLYLKDLKLCASPYDFFDFGTKDKPLHHNDLLIIR